MRRQDRPLTHDWIWRAIDTLAERRSLTPSALARLAGLDPTTFNRSKRCTPEGRPRWPSTESIAKVLEATGTTLDEFAALEIADTFEMSINETSGEEFLGVRVVGAVRDAVVVGWEPTEEPALAAGQRLVPAPRLGRRPFAVAIADSSLEPVYSAGNTLVVSEAAEPRAGDRVLVKPAGMPVMPRLLVSATSAAIELRPLIGGGGCVAVQRDDVEWMARIVLVRQ